MALLIVGFFAIALSIGLANGITASPVMSIVIPLIFSLLTFGGGFYVFIKDLNVAAQKAIGGFFVAFSVGYMSGLFIGAYIKLNGNSLITQENQPAYSDYGYTDVRLLNTFFKLDEMMVRSGLGRTHRKSILDGLYDAVRQRKQSQTDVDNWGVQLQQVWKESMGDEMYALVDDIDYFIYELKDECADNCEKLQKLEAQITALKASAKIKNLEEISGVIDSVIESIIDVKQSSPLLGEEEIKALDSVLNTAKSKGNNWFLHPIADGKGLLTVPVS